MIRILTADEPNAITITEDASSWTTALMRSRRVAIRRWVRGDRSISSYATFLISMNTAAPSYLASLGKAFD